MADKPVETAPVAEAVPETKPEETKAEETKPAEASTAPEVPKTETETDTAGAATGEASTTEAVQPPSVPHWTQPDYEDEFNDADSALGDDNNSSTASISASIMEYRTIHGRTFHAQKGDAEYWGPNDDRQNECMDITHHVFTMLLGDQLHLAPISETVGKVLDVGTGTGIWAIDFADKHPESEVIGTDLSPIQPAWVPPNLKFEIDDVTLPWTYQSDSFDFIHLRYLFGSIVDWNALYEQAYKATKPGGYIESLEPSVMIQSDNGSVVPGMALYDWGRLFQEAGRKLGRSMEVIEKDMVIDAIKAAGFVDIEIKKYKLPVTGYAQDETLRKIGIYNHFATEEGLEGYALYLLTHVMGWAPEQVQLFVARVRKELRLKKVHPWYWIQVIHARKPEAAA